MKCCCFTGHRIIKITPELVQRLRDTIISVIEHGVTDFYDGGATGFDMLAAETVTELKSEHTNIKLHLLLPCSADEQVKGWNKLQITKYEKVLKVADSITIISEHYTRDCMKIRNQQLVELSDCCICYCKNPKSGTGQTMRMAESKGIEIINLVSG